MVILAGPLRATGEAGALPSLMIAVPQKIFARLPPSTMSEAPVI